MLSVRTPPLSPQSPTLPLRSPALAAHGPFLPAAMACLVLGALSLSIGPLLALRGRLGTVAAWGALAWRQGHEGGSRGLRESLLGSQDSDSDDPSSQRGAGQTGQGGDAGSRHSAVAAAMLITAALVGVAAAASTGAAAAVLVPAAALGALSALRWRVAGRLRRSAARLAASTGAPSSMRTGAELRAAGVLAAVLAAVAAAPLDAAVFGQAPWATWVAHSYWRELLLREKVRMTWAMGWIAIESRRVGMLYDPCVHSWVSSCLVVWLGCHVITWVITHPPTIRALPTCAVPGGGVRRLPLLCHDLRVRLAPDAHGRPRCRPLSPPSVAGRVCGAGGRGGAVVVSARGAPRRLRRGPGGPLGLCRPHGIRDGQGTGDEATSQGPRIAVIPS